MSDDYDYCPLPEHESQDKVGEDFLDEQVEFHNRPASEVFNTTAFDRWVDESENYDPWVDDPSAFDDYR
jgi:hypothetical protein